MPILRRDGELDLTDGEAALLVAMSAATIDRRLAGERAKMIVRGRSHTKPGSLLKSQIPIRLRRPSMLRPRAVADPRLPFLLQGCRATGSARGRPCSNWRAPKPVT